MRSGQVLDSTRVELQLVHQVAQVVDAGIDEVHPGQPTGAAQLGGQLLEWDLGGDQVAVMPDPDVPDAIKCHLSIVLLARNAYCCRTRTALAACSTA